MIRSPLRIMIIFAVIFVCSSMLYAQKVLIITHAFNRPNFIKWQHRTFKAFFLDEYEFVVFNDANDPKLEQEISATCAALDIACIRIPQERVHPRNRRHDCERVSDAIQYSLEVLGFDYDGVVAIIDSDMFPIRPFSIQNYLQGYDLAGRIWHPGNNPDITYPWNGLVFMDMHTLPNKRTMNFDCGRVDGYPVDTGGQLHYYLKNNPEIRVRWYVAGVLDGDIRRGMMLLQDRNWLKNQLKYPDYLVDFVMNYTGDMELHAHGSFIHYRAGGNWQKMPAAYHINKEKLLEEFLTVALSKV